MTNEKTPTQSPLGEKVEAEPRRLRRGPQGRTGFWVAGPRHYAYKHGLRRTPEYAIWAGMRRRCFDPKRPEYPYYGGRGITIESVWKDDFAAFYRDMGPRPSAKHTIERLDNEKNYGPANCVWALPLQQAANKRNNRLITYKGETLHLAAMARKYKISIGLLQFRLGAGWSIEKSLLTPRRTHKPYVKVKK